MNSPLVDKIREAAGWPIVAFGFVFVVLGLAVWKGFGFFGDDHDDGGPLVW